MSLLMKALKQAEQRHQQATAEALERSASESIDGPTAGFDTDGSATGPAASTAPADATATARGRGRRAGATSRSLDHARTALDDASCVRSAQTAATGTDSSESGLPAMDCAAIAQSPPSDLPLPADLLPPPDSALPLPELTLADDPPADRAGTDEHMQPAGPARPIPRHAGETQASEPGPGQPLTFAPAGPSISRDATREQPFSPVAPEASQRAAIARPTDAARVPAHDVLSAVSAGIAEPSSAAHVAPRLSRASSRRRRITLWTGAGTAVAVTGAWLGWQLLAPPSPTASASAPHLTNPVMTPAAGGPMIDRPDATAAADVPAQTEPTKATAGAAASATTGATATTSPMTASGNSDAPAPGVTRRGAIVPSNAEPKSEGVRPPTAAAAAPRAPAATASIQADRGAAPVAQAADAGSNEPDKAAHVSGRAARRSAPARSSAPPDTGSAGTDPRPTGTDARVVEPAPRNAGRAVTLVRSDEGERIVRMLEVAYTALQGRDIEAARVTYEKVLAIDQNNTDALTGLATYSARTGNPLQAERLFNQVLAIDPNDQAARAGLVALRTSGDPAGQESQLRHLIAQDDSQPALHYALGNVLASQGRWAEAQQAYFTAVSGDADQPDYAYNLAVSLERLKQPRAAALQYRRALELAAGRPARFPLDRARARLAAIDAAAQRGD